MRDESDIDEQPGADGAPDPHGQAALLLIESIVHGLIARKVITTIDAVEIVEIASDAWADQVEGGGAIGRDSMTTKLLAKIQTSLEYDIDFEQ